MIPNPRIPTTRPLALNPIIFSNLHMHRETVYPFLFVLYGGTRTFFLVGAF